MASFSGISVQTKDAPVNIFISYSHRNPRWKKELEQFLEQYLAEKGQYVRFLSDENLRPSDEWEKQLRQMWGEADIFLVLVSEAYLKSVRKDPELAFILKRVKENPRVKVLPIILEKCDWEKSPVAAYQAIKPFNLLSANSPDQKAAYREIGSAVVTIAYFLRNEAVLQAIEQEKKQRTGVLVLANRNLPFIPRDLLEMPWLKVLDLSRNHISRIENLDRLGQLRKLLLPINDLEHISGLEKLTSLEVLDLQQNKLSQLRGLYNNLRLRELGLSNNQLRTLEGLPELPQLRILYAAHNLLEHVKELAGRPSLQRIVLTNNRIQSLRPLIGHLQRGLPVKLAYSFDAEENGIFVKDNHRLTEPYLEVVQQGREAVLKYFKEVGYAARATDPGGASLTTHQQVKLEIVKLVLVGNSGVGKTNFSQFLRGRRLTLQHNSTHLLDIQRFEAGFLKNKKGQPMLVNVFDFGGQDYYHDSHRLFFSHDTVYVLLWDQATNHYRVKGAASGAAASTIAHEDYPLEYWLESIKYNLREKSELVGKPADAPAAPQPPGVADEPLGSAPLPGLLPPQLSNQDGPARSLADSAPVLILQNKIDQEEGWLDQAQLQKCYPNIKGFFNVALQKKKRTSILLKVLGDYLRQMDFTGRKLLDYEDKIVQHYLTDATAAQQPLRVLELDAFRQECIRIIADASVNFTDGNAQIIARILHNLGVVYYDQRAGDQASLSRVFTRVDELNELIREIMQVAKASNGIFSLSARQRTEPQYEPVLRLLLHNQSIIALSAKPASASLFLAPQFLPTEPEPATRFFLKAFTGCQVRYVARAYFHKTVLLPLFVKYVGAGPAGKDWDSSSYPPFWRNGIVISREVGPKTQLVLVELKQYGPPREAAAGGSAAPAPTASGDEEQKAVLSVRTIGDFDRNGLEREVVDMLDKELQHWAAEKQVSVDGETFFSVKKLKKSVANQLFEFSKKTKQQKAAEKQARKADKMAKPVLPKVFNAHQFKHLVTFENPPQKLFISYSSRNAEYIQHFVTQLKALRSKRSFTFWYDRTIKAGTRWDDTIQAELEKSDAAIFLLSPEFLATDYIMNVEVAQAKKLFERGQLKLFFVELQPCGWHHTGIGDFQQIDDPAKREKNVISIGQPDNHGAWIRVVDRLEKDLFGAAPTQAGQDPEVTTIVDTSASALPGQPGVGGGQVVEENNDGAGNELHG